MQGPEKPDAESQDNSIQPFLKWAGGKRWLVRSEIEYVPETYKRYIEPFFGGGAVFFSQSPTKFLVSDLNQELINCYLAIREDWKKVLSLLRKHQEGHSSKYYYDIRDETPRNQFHAAARFIYLNRTCWNGLYRVNLKGKFNVPKGTKSKVLFETDDFESIANSLSSGRVICQDFQKTLRQAKDGDFIFIDPPYTVAHNMNAFVKYNERIFSWSDQLRLRDEVVRAADKGAMISITNADHESVFDLYKSVGATQRISRQSVISGKNLGRKKTSELLIRIGWNQDVLSSEINDPL